MGYCFNDPELLQQALRHRSWCAENNAVASNERLEFLGDSVLGLAVTDFIYRSYPGLSEGKLAKVRASVVSSVSLADVARGLGLGDAVFLGKGEETSGGRDKSSILADGLEAVLGAVYIDGGWVEAQRVVMDLMDGPVRDAAHQPGTQDFKTRLQEHVARRYDALPAYEVNGDGPDHEKRFYATVTVDSRAIGHGEGRSKKEAEQAAAGAAWDVLASERSEDADTVRAQANSPAEAST